ncbi:MAG TPA: hypothetical protein VNQ72_03715 [Candidatus Dormibacteraeota bacterium]|nr:hypothetical protein [Candidatus Dormibacteraeota bacterium]
MGRTARRSVLILLAATLLAGCATTARPSAARTEQASQAPRPCSTADPDRWAWFCVVGQILYGAASFFTPVNELTMR